MSSKFELQTQDSSPTTHFGDTDDHKNARETAATARPWWMSLSVATRPRCFGCGGRLLPKAVAIYCNYAVCELCADLDQSEFMPFWAAIQSLGSPLEISKSRGIVFWTPPPTLPDQDAYYRWMELWAIMRKR